MSTNSALYIALAKKDLHSFLEIFSDLYNSGEARRAMSSDELSQALRSFCAAGVDFDKLENGKNAFDAVAHIRTSHTSKTAYGQVLDRYRPKLASTEMPTVTVQGGGSTKTDGTLKEAPVNSKVY
ncbi:MAG: hypothetical protein ACOYNL_04635 [Rickettsiales bacterium]